MPSNVFDGATLRQFVIAASFECRSGTALEDAHALATQARRDTLTGWLLLGKDWTAARVEGPVGAILAWRDEWSRRLGLNAQAPALRFAGHTGAQAGFTVARSVQELPSSAAGREKAPGPVGVIGLLATVPNCKMAKMAATREDLFALLGANVEPLATYFGVEPATVAAIVERAEKRRTPRAALGAIRELGEVSKVDLGPWRAMAEAVYRRGTLLKPIGPERIKGAPTACARPETTVAGAFGAREVPAAGQAIAKSGESRPDRRRQAPPSHQCPELPLTDLPEAYQATLLAARVPPAAVEALAEARIPIATLLTASEAEVAQAVRTAVVKDPSLAIWSASDVRAWNDRLWPTLARPLAAIQRLRSTVRIHARVLKPRGGTGDRTLKAVWPEGKAPRFQVVTCGPEPDVAAVAHPLVLDRKALRVAVTTGLVGGVEAERVRRALDHGVAERPEVRADGTVLLASRLRDERRRGGHLLAPGLPGRPRAPPAQRPGAGSSSDR